MSLDFDFSKVQPRSLWETADGTEWTWEAQALPWAAMAIGIGSITEKNVEEFALRLRLWEKVVGAFRVRHDDAGRTEVPFTLAELRPFIGFRTNVSTESRATFLRKLAEGAERDIRREARKIAEEAAAA